MTARLADSRLALTPDLHPGYRLRRLRGIGGFGEVWEAEKDGGGAVALKFLPKAGVGGAKQELRSIQVVQEACHDHLIRIDSVWCAGGFLVVAMELADGSLADLLDVYLAEFGAPLPPGHLLPLLTQAANALDFLNTRRHLIHGEWVTIQHCDVTVRNLLVLGKTLKLSDFGLTTTLMGRQKVHNRSGTPAYAAPEVFQGRLTDRTDQYALAVCYCVLRGGKFPFADTPADFQSGYTRPAPDLGMLAPGEQLAIARALAPAPQDRWPSCGELVIELQRVTSAPSFDRPVAPAGRRSEPR
jgi:serine/threonine protein kinase